MPAISAEARQDLAGKFPRWTEHHDAGALAVMGPRVRGQVMQDRKREGRGFSSSCLGNANHIATRHDDRDCFLLDGCWGGVFFFRNCTRNSVMKAEAIKRSQ